MEDIKTGNLVRVGILDDAPQMVAGQKLEQHEVEGFVCYWFDKNDDVKQSWFKKDQLIVL